MHTLRALARWACLLLLTACGAPAEDAADAEDLTDAIGDVDADAPSPADQGDLAQPDMPALIIEERVERLRYCDVLTQVLLDMEARCDDRAPDARQQQHLVERCLQDTTRPVLQNVVAYDELAAGRCLQSLTQVCFFDEADQGSCALTLRGLQGEGAVCYDDDECDEGHCQHDGRCPGRCRVWSQPGQSCGARQCAPGTFCDPAVWTCAAAWPEGAPCALDTDCASGLTCRRAVASGRNAQPGRTCQPAPARGADGDRCDDETPCAAHLFCLSLPGKDWTQGGTCAPIAAPGDRCPVGGADLRWFTRGCRDSLCKATEGATEGVCASTRLHEPCVRATWTDPAASAPRKPDDPLPPLLESWGCSDGWICHDQYHFCRRPEEWELPALDPPPRACLRP